jgi:hypothetical protein
MEEHCILLVNGCDLVIDSAHNVGKVNMELQLDAKITVLLISKISSTCFGQTFAHFQERKTETFTTYGSMSCYVVGRQTYT